MRAPKFLALGLAALAEPAWADRLCPIAMPPHASSLGAMVELQERLLEGNCQRGDVLAITGDVHLTMLARVCDFSRPVLTEPAREPTNRPHGAVCAFAGVRETRLPAAEAAALGQDAPTARVAPPPASIAAPAPVARAPQPPPAIPGNALATMATAVGTPGPEAAEPPRPAPRPRPVRPPDPLPTGLVNPSAARN